MESRGGVASQGGSMGRQGRQCSTWDHWRGGWWQGGWLAQARSRWIRQSDTNGRESNGAPRRAGWRLPDKIAGTVAAWGVWPWARPSVVVVRAGCGVDATRGDAEKRRAACGGP